jgi:hypothetical protein
MQTFPQGPQGHKGPKNGKQLLFKIFKIEIVVDSIWFYMILLDCDRLWREIRKGHGTWHSAPGSQQQQTKPSHTGAMTIFQVFSAQQPSQFITIHHNSAFALLVLLGSSELEAPCAEPLPHRQGTSTAQESDETTNIDDRHRQSPSGSLSSSFCGGTSQQLTSQELQFFKHCQYCETNEGVNRCQQHSELIWIHKI